MNEFEYYLPVEVEAPSKPGVVFTGNSKESKILVEEPLTIHK